MKNIDLETAKKELEFWQRIDAYLLSITDSAPSLPSFEAVTAMRSSATRNREYALGLIDKANSYRKAA